MLDKDTLESIQQSLKGNKVKVTNYKMADGTITDITGMCYSIGYLPYLPNWGLCMTVDRMPLSNLELSQIELI